MNKKNEPSILVVSNNDPLGLKVVYCLYMGGYRVDVLSLNAGSVLKFSRYVSSHYSLRSNSTEQLGVDMLNDWLITHRAQENWLAVLGDDIFSHGLLHAAAGNHPHNIYAPSPAALLNEAHDKWSFYCALNQEGIQVPESILIRSHDDLTESFVQAVGFPLLVKPLNAESSHGIRRFTDLPSLRSYLSKPGRYRRFPLILQRFVRGETLGVSLLAHEGQILSSDLQLHAANGSRTFVRDESIESMARDIIGVFNYSGPAHIDFIRDSDTGCSFALELNSRFWFSVTVSAWRGGNFPCLAVDATAGRNLPVHPTDLGAYYQPGTVARMFLKPWRLLRLDQRNWRGFWQAISDPVPHAMSLFSR